jgi:acyl carrier protein
VRKKRMANGEGFAGDDVKVKVDSYIRDSFLLGDTSVELGDDESLFDRGVIDSTGVLELVSFIEETFNMKVEDEELVPDNLDSLKKISDFVQRKLGRASS